MFNNLSNNAIKSLMIKVEWPINNLPVGLQLMVVKAKSSVLWLYSFVIKSNVCGFYVLVHSFHLRQDFSSHVSLPLAAEQKTCQLHSFQCNYDKKKKKKKKKIRSLRLANKVAPTKCCCDSPDCWVTSKYQMVDSLRQVNKAPGSQRFSLIHAYLCPHKCNFF